MDWEGWARRFERVRGPDAFAALFAEGGTFQDPVTAPTTDVRSVAEMTDSLFPDWAQRVDRIFGGEGWAWFEWTGTATHRAPGAASGVPIEMHGATVVEVDGGGLVTRWRDYLDTNEPIQQMAAGPQGREGVTTQE